MSMLPRLFAPRRRSDAASASGHARRGRREGTSRVRLLAWVPLLLAVLLWALSAGVLMGGPAPAGADPALLERLAGLQLRHVLSLVVLTVTGVACAGLAARWWVRRQERPAWSLYGLEQRLFEHAPGAVVVTDAYDRILAVNSA